MKLISTREFNTCNALGFGGAKGTEYEYDNGVIEIKGRNYHRHTGTSSANSVYVRIHKKFTIEVRKDVGLSGIGKLDKITTISVLKSPNSSHWQAIGKDLDRLSLYGEDYLLDRKIQIAP